MNILGIIDENLMDSPNIGVKRASSFYPSSAMSNDLTDGITSIGACMRSEYYRCKRYPVTNPNTLYSQYVFASGNIWEDWLIDRFKISGVYIGSNIKWIIPGTLISGEIDIAIRDPYRSEGQSEFAVVECKTYTSSNYNAKKEITGNKSTKPRPKDSNLMQSFIYIHGLEHIDKTYLVYLDRACGGPENNKSFEVINYYDESTEMNYPKVTYLHNGSIDSYVDYRFSIESIMESYNSLYSYIRQNTLPPKSYTPLFSEERIEKDFEEGKIAKTRYENYKKDSSRFPIRDWRCSYCSYLNQCLSDENSDSV